MGPARKAGPDAFWASFERWPPLRTLVEPVQTGFSRRAPSWFLATPPKCGRDGCTRLAREPPLRKTKGSIWDETSSIHQGRRSRRCRERNRRAGDRAVNAGSQMANDLQLAEIARHAVW